MKSLSWKIFFGFLMVIFIFTGLVLFFSFGKVKKHFNDNSIDELRLRALLVADQLESQSFNHEEIRLKLINLDGKTGTRFTLIDSNGIATVDSRINPNIIDNVGFESHFNKLKTNNIKYDIIQSSDLVSVIMLLNNNLLLKSTINLDDKTSINELLRDDIFIISLFIVMFAFFFVLFFSSKVVKPIKWLTRASRKVALGDFDNKIFIAGNDEISQLARNFNQMTEKLKDYFLLAESQQEQYLTLISSLQASLIVVNKDGKILLHNKSFEILSKTNILKGRFFWEIIPSVEFRDLIKLVEKKKKHITKELEIQNSFYLCSANFIESKNEVVVLFHDITEIKILESVKKDFVVNVTHELRTPLTAIKGFVETIEDDLSNGDDVGPYIEIIKRHTERLINIVQDLLTLSEIEQKNSHIKLSDLNIYILADNMLKLFEPKLKSKNLELIIKIEDNLPNLILDAFRIEQVLINLIDNAIKYTDFGYIKLEISRENDIIKLVIEDTGLGIPKEHHKRLFERFYTVDRSRSRKVGGTGLGLSIVKHIIMLHNGEIKVESGSGNGTKFIILIPQNHFDAKKSDNEILSI